MAFAGLCRTASAAFCLTLAAAMMPSAASAQQRQPTLLAPPAMFESVHRMSETIRRIVGARLVARPFAAVTPLVLGYAETGEAAYADIPDGDARQAMAAATKPPLLWNVWADVTGGYVDDDDPVRGFDGTLTTVSVGGDRKIGDRAVLGVIGNFERSDFDTNFGPGRLESDAAGFGLYGGVALTNHLVADASFLWKRLDNFTALRAAGVNFDSERWQAAANLTGYWYVGRWRLSPKAGVSWAQEDQDAYADPTLTIVSPEQQLTTTTLSAGMEVGHTFALANGGSIEPWLGAAVEWKHVDFGSARPAGLPASDDDFADLRLSGGLISNVSERLSIGLKVNVTGLIRDDYFAATVGGRVAFRL